MEWTEAQLTVLFALFVCRGFHEGDDNHPTNHRIATAFGRTPSAIDRQWRNIKHHLFRLDLYGVTDHVGQNVMDIIDEYRTDLAVLRQEGRRLIQQQWPALIDLI